MCVGFKTPLFGVGGLKGEFWGNEKKIRCFPNLRKVHLPQYPDGVSLSMMWFRRVHHYLWCCKRNGRLKYLQGIENNYPEQYKHMHYIYIYMCLCFCSCISCAQVGHGEIRIFLWTWKPWDPFIDQNPKPNKWAKNSTQLPFHDLSTSIILSFKQKMRIYKQKTSLFQQATLLCCDSLCNQETELGPL